MTYFLSVGRTRRLLSFVIKFLPINVFKLNMIQYLIRSILAHSLLRIYFDASIDKVFGILQNHNFFVWKRITTVEYPFLKNGYV